MKLGFIGLGKMGSRMVLKLLQEGHEVIVWNRSEEPIKNLNSSMKNQISPLRPASPGFAGQANLKSATQNFKSSRSIEELVKILKPPRVVWMMLPAGEATESVLNEVTKFIDPEDIIIDGGNSNYKDTQRRYEELRTKNINFLGIGVSGGIIGFEKGYSMMVGGDKDAYKFIKPILDSLAKPARHASKALRAGQSGGYEYFGVGGAGHFVKMVHNGIEYGMMQALGEGFEVLQKSEYNFDLKNIAKAWQKGTIISGFLIDRAADALEKDQTLSESRGAIAQSGEARWTIEQAKEENVPVEIIEKSLEFRLLSQKDLKLQKSFTAKIINALRHEFGGHEVRKK